MKIPGGEIVVYALKFGKRRAKIAGGGRSAKILSRRFRDSRTISDPSRRIRPRPIDCDSGRDRQTNILLFLEGVRASKKHFVSRPLSSHDLHSKRSPQPYFSNRGVISCATKGGRKKHYLARQALPCRGSDNKTFFCAVPTR